MADDRGRREPLAGPDPAEVVRPSPRARERFAAELRGEVEATRAAWYDATLRGRERLLAGDDHGAMEAIEDQRRLLQLLERRLERVVASAAVEREAEAVLAGSDALMTTGPRAQADAVTPPRPVGVEGPGAEDPSGGSGGRLRALVAAGAAAAVTAVTVGLGALVGPVATPAPEVAGPVDGTADEASADDADAARQQDIGTAEQTPPLPVEPPTSTLWPRDWKHLWSSGDGAGHDVRADGGQREDADPEGPDQRDDIAAADAPSTSSDDGSAQDDATHDDGDAGPDADERDPQEQDELLDLRRLIQPEDGGGEDQEEPRDEELPEADADATASPDEESGERDDVSEESTEDPARLDDRS